MRVSGKIWRPIAAGAAIFLAASVPAAAWDEQGGALKSLPSGGLMLKEVPGTDSNLQNLPGVRLNPQMNSGGSGNCSQREVTHYRYGFGEQSGTATECNFGNFSVTTYNSGSASGSAYNPFPVPGPLQEFGPPPGSGGYAPRQRSPFN